MKDLVLIVVLILSVFIFISTMVMFTTGIEHAWKLELIELESKITASKCEG